MHIYTHTYTQCFQDVIASCYFVGVMVWPDTYDDEELEITYNMSDKNNWMTKSKILQDFLERTYQLFMYKPQK